MFVVIRCEETRSLKRSLSQKSITTEMDQTSESIGTIEQAMAFPTIITDNDSSVYAPKSVILPS